MHVAETLYTEEYSDGLSGIGFDWQLVWLAPTTNHKCHGYFERYKLSGEVRLTLPRHYVVILKLELNDVTTTGYHLMMIDGMKRHCFIIEHPGP